MTLQDPMSVLCAPASVAPGRADAAAQHNRAANLRALAQTQPSLTIALALRSPNLRWIFGRDGCLTAQTPAGEWLADCSLPRRAAEALLGRPNVTGTTACFLSPSHAAQLRVALDALRADQAIIAIVPDLQTLAHIVHCADFSAAIAARRLWFAAGSDWTSELKTILTDHPGLPTPLQFLRTTLLHGDEANTLIPLAERTFSAAAEQRSKETDQLRQQRRERPGTPRLCLLGSSRFRLWEDAARILCETASQTGLPTDCVDSDRPDQASNLALAISASQCDVLLTAHAGRADLPRVLRPDLAVITWVTGPRIPAPDAQSPHDALILADDAWLAPARRAGWPAGRLMVGTWPACPNPAAPDMPAHLSIIADTADTSPDRHRFDLSSHRLLWEMIQEELLKNPIILTPDIGGYLRARMAQLGIQPDGLDARRFIEELILPACQQGMATILLRAGLSLRLHGRGWSDVPQFRPHAMGEVASTRELIAAAQAATALVHAWPASGAHPIDAMRRPVLRAADAQRFIAAARNALVNPPLVRQRAPELTPAALRDLIGLIFHQ